MRSDYKHRIIRYLGWLMVATVMVLSLVRLPTTATSLVGGDKLLHLTTYFVLCFWFFHAYTRQSWSIVIGFAVLGAVLEGLQSMTGYRYMEWLDLNMNLFGVLLAWVLFNHFKIKINILICK